MIYFRDLSELNQCSFTQLMCLLSFRNTGKYSKGALNHSHYLPQHKYAIINEQKYFYFLLFGYFPL